MAFLLAADKSRLTILVPSVWETLLILLALGIIIWLTLMIRAWFRDDEDVAAAERELLGRTHDLLREGELTEEEYRMIRSRLANSSQQKLIGNFQQPKGSQRSQSRGGSLQVVPTAANESSSTTGTSIADSDIAEQFPDSQMQAAEPSSTDTQQTNSNDC
jgi:hypothetical protein